MNPSTLGKRIRAKRQIQHLSQEDLALQLGVSRQAVSKWETDRSVPDTENLIALAALFSTTVEQPAGTQAPSSTSAADGRIPLARRFYVLALVFGAAAALLYGIGLFSGEFNRAVTLPLGGGAAMGIPLLYYGRSGLAVGLWAGTALCTALAVFAAAIGSFFRRNSPPANFIKK